MDTKEHFARLGLRTWLLFKPEGIRKPERVEARFLGSQSHPRHGLVGFNFFSPESRGSSPAKR